MSRLFDPTMSPIEKIGEVLLPGAHIVEIILGAVLYHAAINLNCGGINNSRLSLSVMAESLFFIFSSSLQLLTLSIFAAMSIYTNTYGDETYRFPIYIRAVKAVDTSARVLFPILAIITLGQKDYHPTNDDDYSPNNSQYCNELKGYVIATLIITVLTSILIKSRIARELSAAYCSDLAGHCCHLFKKPERIPLLNTSSDNPFSTEPGPTQQVSTV